MFKTLEIDDKNYQLYDWLFFANFRHRLSLLSDEVTLPSSFSDCSCHSFYTNYSNCSFLNSFKVTYIFLRCLFIWLKNKIIFSLFTKQLSYALLSADQPVRVSWVSRMRRRANIKLVKICKHYLWFPLSPETWLLKTLCNLITKSFQTQTNNLQQHYTSTGLIRKLSFLIFIDLYFLSFSLSDEWARNLYLIWSIFIDSLEIF